MLENTPYLAAKHVMFDQLEKLGHQIISVYEEDVQPFVTGDHNISNCPPNWKKTHDHLAPEIAVLENCYLFPNGAVLTETRTNANVPSKKKFLVILLNPVWST